MNKTGILWKLRLPEQEISIAGSQESGPVRTFKCLPKLFEKLRREEVREGCYIQANFCMKKRIIIDVERIMLEGYVTKWAAKYAFVHTSILPQIKLLSNNRVAEIKFIHNPPHSLSSTYLDPADCDFALENNMAIRFSLIVNLKKTSNLRNSPYCGTRCAKPITKIDKKDLKAIKVEKLSDGSCSRRSSQSSQAVDSESRINSWLDRRMSSPRASRSPGGRRTPEARTPEPKLDEGMRRRGGSTPVKKHVKRDPSRSKKNTRKRPPQSAPVTPAKDIDTPELELKNVVNGLQSKSRPQSAKTSLDSPPKRCLRCQEDDVEECKHKPPHSRTIKEPKGKRTDDELSLILQDKDAECARLRQALADLQLQLSQQQQTSHSNVQPSYNYRRPYTTPSLHVSYDQAIKNKHYDTIFAHSPSVSPSSSPVPEMFQDPEKFLPFLASGGKPSSTCSEIIRGPTHLNDTMVHQHYGTPMTHTLDVFHEPDDFFPSASRSATSTPSWATNSDQLTARECMDYYEPSLPFECAVECLYDMEHDSRKSPREMSEVLHVPPLELPPAKLDGERRPHQSPLVNQDQNLNKADNSRWAPVCGEEFSFSTPTKRHERYRPSSSKTSRKTHSKAATSPYKWDY